MPRKTSFLTSLQSGVARLNEWSNASARKGAERKAERKARLAAQSMPRKVLRNGVLVGALALLPISHFQGWAITAGMVSLGLVNILLPLLEKRPRKRVWLPMMIAGHPVSMAVILLGGALGYSALTGQTLGGVDPLEVRNKNAVVRAHREELGKELSVLEEHFQAGTLHVLGDERISLSHQQWHDPLYGTRNDIPLMKFAEWVTTKLGAGIDQNFDRSEILPLATALRADRLVIFWPKDALEKKYEAREKSLSDLLGVAPGEVTPEQRVEHAPEYQGVHALFCALRGEEVLAVNVLPDAVYFDIENMPEASPARRICSAAAKMTDLSHLPSAVESDQPDAEDHQVAIK